MMSLTVCKQSSITEQSHAEKRWRGGKALLIGTFGKFRDITQRYRRKFFTARSIIAENSSFERSGGLHNKGERGC